VQLPVRPSGQAEIDTWAGATVDELYLAYGTPSKSVEQVDGITIVEFQHSRLSTQPRIIAPFATQWIFLPQVDSTANSSPDY